MFLLENGDIQWGPVPAGGDVGRQWRPDEYVAALKASFEVNSMTEIEWLIK